MKKIFTAVLAFAFLAVLVAPVIVGAQTVTQGRGSVDSCGNLQGEGVAGIVKCIVAFFDYFVYLIIALSVVYIVLGAFKMIYSEEKRDEGKQTVYYGVIALFVMMSIWGFVNILNNTFRLNTDADPTDTIRLIP